MTSIYFFTFFCKCLILAVIVPHVHLVIGQVLLRVQRGHASRTSARDGLLVSLILDITSSKHTLNTGQCRAGLCLDVTIRVHIDLTLDELCRGVVADGVEKTVGLNCLLLAGLDVLDDNVGHETVITATDLGRDAVELDGDLGVREKPVGHGAAGAEFTPPDKNGNVATVLCQERSLLGRRVTTANNEERLVAEDGDGTVADGAGGDAVLPVLVLAGEVHAAGGGAGGEDDGVGGVCLVRVEFGGEGERALGEVEVCDGVCDDFGAEAFGLGAHVVL